MVGLFLPLEKIANFIEESVIVFSITAVWNTATGLSKASFIFGRKLRLHRLEQIGPVPMRCRECVGHVVRDGSCVDPAWKAAFYPGFLFLLPLANSCWKKRGSFLFEISQLWFRRDDDTIRKHRRWTRWEGL